MRSILIGGGPLSGTIFDAEERLQTIERVDRTNGRAITYTLAGQYPNAHQAHPSMVELIYRAPEMTTEEFFAERQRLGLPIVRD